MHRHLRVIIVLIAVGVLAAAIFLVSKRRSGPPVTVKVRIAVTPSEQSSFVAAQAGSSRFKYLAGKQAGVKPALAQRLAIKPVPNSALLDAEVHLQTREEAQNYLGGFLETLQLVCGTQAQVAVTQQSIH